MYAEERRQHLVDFARTNGRVEVSVAANSFNVTPETIRRDLESLDRRGILRRVHGGAMPTELLPMGDLTLSVRESSASVEKESIARAALALLPTEPGSSVLFDAGTTTGRLAAILPAETNLVVFTSSLPIASMLSSRTDCQVEMLGGRVKGVTQTCVGAQALDTLARIRVDVAFLGTNGLSVEHGLSTPDPEESLLKRRMVACARKTVVLSDSRKFGAETTSSFASLTDIDVLVTESITATQRAACSERGIEVVVA